MADAVHAAMHGVQPTARQPMADRTTAESELDELRASDYPMLLTRKRRDSPVD